MTLLPLWFLDTVNKCARRRHLKGEVLTQAASKEAASKDQPPISLEGGNAEGGNFERGRIEGGNLDGGSLEGAAGGGRGQRRPHID